MIYSYSPHTFGPYITRFCVSVHCLLNLKSVNKPSKNFYTSDRNISRLVLCEAIPLNLFFCKIQVCSAGIHLVLD
jgi:hypothetical protein